MAEKEKKASKDKKGKKHLRAITTHRAEDGGFIHEHHYTDADGQALPPSYGGVSSDMDDLHQHMQDHFGGDEENPDEQDPEAQPQQGAAEPQPTA
jgi:hypothetical protein